MKDYIKKLLNKDIYIRTLWYLLYMFIVVLVQTMVLTHIRVAGVCAFILPTAAVAVGMFEGSTWGTLFGLLMGIITDMFFVESTVMYTMLFPAIGFATGFVSQFFINRRFLSYMVSSAAALLITGFVQMLGVSVSDVWSISMIGTVLLETLWSIPIAAVVYLPPAKWID